MSVRTTILTKDGAIVGDLLTDAAYEYIKNAKPNPGRAEFSVSYGDAKYVERYLKFGNFVLFRHTYLPDWIGVIIKKTYGNGEVNVLAFQAEYILQRRITPQGQKFQGTAGALFTQILNYTNSAPFNHAVIFPNSIFSGGPEREETLGNNALSHIGAISDRSGNDFSVGYTFDSNGRLRLLGNWYQKKGVITNKHLREGRNIRVSDNVLTEDARQLANWTEGRADASTTGTRLTSVAYNQPSIDYYGLWQDAPVFDGNKDQGTIDQNTQSALRISKDPAQTFDLVVPENVVDSAGFSYLKYMDTGNVFELDLNEDGFENGTTGTHAQVEVTGMEYDSVAKTCRVIVEKYYPDLQ